MRGASRALMLLVNALSCAVFAAAAQAQCPAKTVEVSREVISTDDQDTIKYHCHLIAKLSPEELKGLTSDELKELSPEDRKQAEFLMRLQNADQRDRPTQAPTTSDLTDRSAYRYFSVIEQFHVEQSPRYAPDVNTYCNIFVWDVTRAMNAEIPHWIINNDPEASSAIGASGAFSVGPQDRQETRVNDLVDWLKDYGQAHGWRRVDARMAEQMAEEGRPSIAIAASVDPSHAGHVAMIRPATVNDPRGPALTQAGRKDRDASHLVSIPAFTDPAELHPIQYWYHQ